MKQTITIQYDSNYKKTAIECLGRKLNFPLIEDKPIESWINPFVYNGQKWNGIYKELSNSLGIAEFDVDFDGDEKAFNVLKYSFTGTPVTVKNVHKDVMLIYSEDPFTTKILVNGNVIDTMLIQNRCIEEWIGSIQVRDRFWEGIFKEIEKATGSNKYTINFIGDLKSYDLLMEKCPPTVNLFYKDTKAVNMLNTPNVAANIENITSTAKNLVNNVLQADNNQIAVSENDSSAIKKFLPLIVTGVIIVLLLFPFAKFDTQLIDQSLADQYEMFGEPLSIKGYEAFLGIASIKVGKNSVLPAWLLILVPIFMGAYRFIAPLKPYEKILAKILPLVGIIGELISLLSLKGLVNTFNVEPELTKMVTKLSVGFIGILICYVFLEVYEFVLKDKIK